MNINPESWKKDLPAFKEKTDAFYRGEVPKNEYKGFSGFMAVMLKRVVKPVCFVFV